MVEFPAAEEGIERKASLPSRKPPPVGETGQRGEQQ
jgi:hypothetical protein